MIVDSSVVIDALTDPGPRGMSARNALAEQPAGEPLIAPGHFAFEIMSGLRAVANRPASGFTAAEVSSALRAAESLGITIEATPWVDVRRAWDLAQSSLTYADAIYVAAAERRATTLVTADARIGRSGAAVTCRIHTLRPAQI